MSKWKEENFFRDKGKNYWDCTYSWEDVRYYITYKYIK